MAGIRLGAVAGQASLARLRRAPTRAPVFILGNGRSGTHWLGFILDAHPDISVTFEQRPIFGWVTQMALDSRKEPTLLPKLVRRYRLEIAAAAPRIFVDKSHPNLWLAESLAGEFPEARFVGIYRGPQATVASMLKHRRVSEWHDRWSEYPVPNRFLGITEQMANAYDGMPLARRCAIRWQAHLEELRRLDEVLGPRFHLVSYESLHLATASEIQRLGEFLDLRSPIPAPQIRSGSLNRWESELDPETQKQIRDVVGSE